MQVQLLFMAIGKTEADELKKQLEEAGATVSIK